MQNGNVNPSNCTSTAKPYADRNSGNGCVAQPQTPNCVHAATCAQNPVNGSCREYRYTYLSCVSLMSSCSRRYHELLRARCGLNLFKCTYSIRQCDPGPSFSLNVSILAYSSSSFAFLLKFESPNLHFKMESISHPALSIFSKKIHYFFNRAALYIHLRGISRKHMTAKSNRQSFLCSTGPNSSR
jgi:hypothetical protein